MFNATLAPITRSERICFNYWAGGEPGHPRKGEVVHSTEVDWEETRSLREQYQIKGSEEIVVVHYTTPGLVRQAEAREASRPIGSLADIWPSV
jgi:hypothetical protein